MKTFRHLAACLIVSAIGCIPTVTPAETAAAIKFIDLSIFDSQLKQAIDKNDGSIQITFVDNVKVSQMPNRLQTWLDTLQSAGGSLTLSDAENTLEPGIFPLLSLIPPIYTIWGSIKKEKAPEKLNVTYNINIVMVEKNNDRYIKNITLKKSGEAAQ